MNRGTRRHSHLIHKVTNRMAHRTVQECLRTASILPCLRPRFPALANQPCVPDTASQPPPLGSCLSTRPDRCRLTLLSPPDSTRGRRTALEVDMRPCHLKPQFNLQQRPFNPSTQRFPNTRTRHCPLCRCPRLLQCSRRHRCLHIRLPRFQSKCRLLRRCRTSITLTRSISRSRLNSTRRLNNTEDMHLHLVPRTNRACHRLRL